MTEYELVVESLEEQLFPLPTQQQAVDMLYAVPLALGMLYFRSLCEKRIFAPLGKRMGIKDRMTSALPDFPALERAYAVRKKWTNWQIHALARQLNMTMRNVETWLRMRRAQDRPSKLTKFSENSWRFLYYTTAFLYGLITLWDKPWFWDIQECWYGFPNNQIVTGDIRLYYLISMSFYVSLCISQFFDIKRKDFWQMFAHHIITIFLIALSWHVNAVRIGSLVLVLHDCADLFLEIFQSAKVAKYAHHETTTEILFVVFTIVWITTRIFVFPLWILRNTLFNTPTFPTLPLFNSLLCILFSLHLFWTYLILKIAVNFFKSGRVDSDIRSSSEDED